LLGRFGAKGIWNILARAIQRGLDTLSIIVRRSAPHNTRLAVEVGEGVWALSLSDSGEPCRSLHLIEAGGDIWVAHALQRNLTKQDALGIADFDLVRKTVQQLRKLLDGYPLDDLEVDRGSAATVDSHR
jgi:hypothetical protein